MEMQTNREAESAEDQFISLRIDEFVSFDSYPVVWGCTRYRQNQREDRDKNG